MKQLRKKPNLKNVKSPPSPKSGKMGFTSGDLELGERIRLRRLELDLSQEALATKLGISFQQIQKYEKGRNHVSVVRLEQIANALGTPASFFYEDRSGKQHEVESLLMLDPDFSLRLLRIYARVKDKETQRKIIGLIQGVVDALE